jgi:hypothetical protein
MVVMIVVCLEQSFYGSISGAATTRVCYDGCRTPEQCSTDQIGTQRPSLTTVNSVHEETYSSLFPRFNIAHFSRYA